MEEEGQAFSLSNDTESAVASMLLQVGSSDPAGLVERCARLSFGMVEKVLHGSVWRLTSLLLRTDGVVKTGTASCLWNVGDKYGLLAIPSSEC